MSAKQEKNGISSSKNTKTKSSYYLIHRAITSNSQWPDKDDFLDVIYWGRQILGLILGVIWGVIPLKGFLGLLLFCIVSAVAVYLYAFTFQNVDEEDYGGAWEIVKEGFVTSFAGFLAMWIIIFSGLHFKD
ncbi:Rab5-interacting protein family [Trinorchestia longiramus]|nr:Rab5-interacting protein family [Trinorchestia longiramus]